MFSKGRIKLITSLKQKKFRNQHQMFVVEGIKTINEFLNSAFELESLYTLSSFEGVDSAKQFVISEKQLQQISFLKNTSSSLAIFKMKEKEDFNSSSSLIVALDNVRDPGNLGTIIRLCDWFGVTRLICNSETVDCYNPKVIQATMGSLTRVDIQYVKLESYLQGKRQSDIEIYGAFMDGENIYSSSESFIDGVLVLGNEANGISESIEKLITKRTSIPRFGKLKAAESLNVAMAASILLSEFKRKS